MNAIPQLRYDSPGSLDPALLFAAVQALPSSLAVVDSGTVLYVNPAWARMFGYADPGEIQGRALDEFVPQQLFRTPLVLHSDGGRVEQGTVFAAGEFALHRRDGTPIELQMTWAGYRVRGKEFQVVSAGAVRPPAEMREAQRLEAVGRLAGGVAHDFNNLLTGLMLYCDLLIAEVEPGSRSHRHAQEIRRAGEHGAKVVQQLLAMARPQALQSRVCQFNEVVTGIQELLSRLIGENIILITSLGGDVGAVRMDPAQVQQILLNLVLNARDAMPNGGQITIATRNGTNSVTALEESRGLERNASPPLLPWVELAVTDTGCGMDNATLGRAFEPFFTTKEPGRGTGLGLATACRLAKLEGGSIVAESQPGKGTRVSLRLPRAARESAADTATLIPKDSGTAPARNVPGSNVPNTKWKGD